MFHFFQTGWTGDSCECSLDQSTCVSPMNGKICSGNGECDCGKCQCKRIPSGEIWTGRNCDECPTCNDECAAYDPCVVCKAFATDDTSSYKCKENCNFDMQIVKKFSYLSDNQMNRSNDSTAINEVEAPSLVKRCIMIDEYNCKCEF